MSNLVDDLHENNVKISAFIGDNPKRSIARNCLSHSSNFACEYCDARAALFRPADYVSTSARKATLTQELEQIDENLELL